MPRADEFQRITEHVFFWQAYEPKVKSDLSCCAVRTAEGLVFIDPIPLADEAMEELCEVAPAIAVVVTNGNHARAAAAFRERLSVPVCAHAAAVAELGISVDRILAEGECVADGLAVIELPGAAPGEIALHSASGGLHVGDALIHVERLGFTFLPEKYCADPALLRISAQKLLPFDFDVLTFAHGVPLVSKARQRLAQLLAS